MPRAAQPKPDVVRVYPVPGFEIPDVPARATDATPEAAEDLVASGAFTTEAPAGAAEPHAIVGAVDRPCHLCGESPDHAIHTPPAAPEDPTTAAPADEQPKEG